MNKENADKKREEGPVFDTERLIPTYFKMALPVVLSMVVTLVYNLADTYFIARTNDPFLVAGVSLCAPLFMALMAVGNIFGQGGNSLIARLLGANDRKSTRRISSFCFWTAIALGVVLSIPLLVFKRPFLDLLGASEDTLSHAEAYYTVISAGAPLIIVSFIHSNLIRSEGMATHSMAGTIAGAVLNIILDPLFISVFGWGARGAALATVLGYVLTDVLCLIFVLQKSSALSVSISLLKVKWAEFRQIISVGFTAALTNVASSVCLVFMNQFLKPYGDDKIAALGIVMKITMVVQLILVGFSFGGVPLFGFLYGAGKEKKLRKLIRFCTLFLTALAFAESVLVFLLAEPLMRVFIKDAAIVADGSVMLRWQIAGMAFAGIVLLYTCLFQASGKALQALILSLSRQGILFIGVFFLLTSLLKYQGFLMSQPAADLFSALLAILLFVLTFRKKPGDQN